MSSQEAHQPQVTSVSDGMAPHLLYYGPFPFPSVPTPGRFPSTPEYGAGEHTSPSAQSKRHALNCPLSPPLFQNGLGATHYCAFSDQPLKGRKFMYPSNNMPTLLSDAEFGAISYAEPYQYSLLSGELPPNYSECIRTWRSEPYGLPTSWRRPSYGVVWIPSRQAHPTADSRAE